MSIVSASFLFLFFPAAVGVYYLIPKTKSLYWRNLFLALISLFFYAWGEPVFVLLLLALILLTRLLGKLVEGKKNTKTGRFIVLLTVLLNVGVIVFFKDPAFFLPGIGRFLSSRNGYPPLGMSFFVFSAISYVVDIYRGQIRSPDRLLYTVLYLSVFFKVTEGPITEYNQFASQIESRNADWSDLYGGIRRVIIGLAEKMLIAGNLSHITEWIYLSETDGLTVLSAWIGCLAYMIRIYFDFAGYSNMAIGLGQMFGFRLPENFNYPYIAVSVTEYWTRWHMTLIKWFKDYLYYPLMLGPSVKLRKFLIRHHVNKDTAKTLQTVFVPACVWIPTALWHGTNLNYTLWGVLNCAVCILEMYKKPFKSKRLTAAVGWLYTFLFLLLMKPLICTADLGTAGSYYAAMFGLKHNAFAADSTWFLLKEYGVFLLIGLIGCFPIRKTLEARWHGQKISRVKPFLEAATLLILFVLSLAYVFKTNSTFFIYQMF